MNKLLLKLGACREAIEWTGDMPLHEAWEKCERADWMLWLVGKMADKKGWPTRKEVVLAACDCAETALKFVKKGEDRPRKAIEKARLWAEDKATINQVRDAYAAAYAAYAAYAAAYAADAAYAAAYAADAAYAAAYAAYAADAHAAAYAADAAAKNKIREESLGEMSVLIRKRLKIPVEAK